MASSTRGCKPSARPCSPEGPAPSRFFHIPGDPPRECFQIVVFPPSSDRVVVQAAAIDTNDGAEMEMLQTSEGSIADLDALLAWAVATIETWKQRHQDRRV
jgi:hypothetical protein